MRFDVVMPTYNPASLIGAAIHSFLASTYDEPARPVVDNNSKDGTRAAVEAARVAHPTAAVDAYSSCRRAVPVCRIAASEADVILFSEYDEHAAARRLSTPAWEFADPDGGSLPESSDQSRAQGARTRTRLYSRPVLRHVYDGKQRCVDDQCREQPGRQSADGSAPVP